jgi:hypothetical protein
MENLQSRSVQESFKKKKSSGKEATAAFFPG